MATSYWEPRGVGPDLAVQGGWALAASSVFTREP